MNPKIICTLIKTKPNFLKNKMDIPFYILLRSQSSLSGDNVKEPPESCKTCEKLIKDENGMFWRPRKFQLHTIPFYYASASKLRLTSMVVLTTLGGCITAPMPFDPYTTFIMAISSLLMGSSANSINQLMEYPHDSQMFRTKKRLLPLKIISTSHMLAFGITNAALGCFILLNYTNPLTLILSITNFLIYVAVYTPMKQMSIYNTWVGSIVGAIPPLAGYTAMTGIIDTDSLFLPLILFCWQFPHFNSLSWLIRDGYARAGIKMMANYDVTLLSKVTIRYVLITTLICFLMPLICNITTPLFMLSSLFTNIPIVWLSHKFSRVQNNKNALRLFKASLIQLFVLVILFIAHKSPLPRHEDTYS